ncbi:DNA internalization-related competence protein ComEC/Rec2 [Leucobacter denitrificans]|nr:DNA internalization-related competence protein ComEC/Rec2 [Leucobacter denitrificans]
MQIALTEHAREDPVLVSAAESGGEISALVSISDYPSASVQLDGRVRGWVRAEVKQVNGTHLYRPVKLMLWLNEMAPQLWAPGAEVSVTGAIARSPPEGGTAYEMSVSTFDTGTKSKHNQSSLSNQIGRGAAALRNGLRDASARQPDAALVPGFAVGDTSLVSDELEALMLESSLTHLTAVSGSNCALVVSAFVGVAAWLGAGRRTRRVIAGAGLALFVILVGPDASVQRAAVMATVLLVSDFGGKKGRSLPSLGLAVLVLLVHDPWQSIQPGFVLSVAATTGIVLWSPSVEQWLRTTTKLPKILAIPVAVACVAQFFCAPFLLLLQPGISLGGVLANVVAAPAAPLGTALGMVALVLLPLHSGIGALVVGVATWPARWVQAAGELSLMLPLHRLHWPSGWGGALLLAAVEALLFTSILLRSGRVTNGIGERLESFGPWRRVPSGPLSLRVALQVVSATAAGVLIAIVAIVPVSVRLGVPDDWFMVTCDVGQGDAILLRDPQVASSVMLIDTGDDPERLNSCLELFGVNNLAHVILTHDDRDHVGALSTVLRRTEQVIIAPSTRDQEEFRPLEAQLKMADVQVQTGAVGTGALDAGLQWEFIGPNPNGVPEDTNAASLVLSVSVAGTRVVLLADTGEDEQQWLSTEYPELQADVVKVAHHGSKDQSLDWYEQLDPTVALISVGENRYGHPNGALIETLELDGAAVLRTDELGSIALRVEEGARIEAWTAGRQD